MDTDDIKWELENLQKQINDQGQEICSLENELDDVRTDLENLKNEIESQIKRALIEHGLIPKPQYWGDDW